MLIAERLRGIREGKKLSQGDIEERTGLLRSYISRVENGNTVPSISTLEKIARALEMPLYALLYDGEELPEIPPRVALGARRQTLWGSSGNGERMLLKFQQLMGRLSEHDRRLLVLVAQRIVRLRASRSPKKTEPLADRSGPSRT
jgi:transcriptional regulator with XRE-family HTH domain